MKKLLLGIGLGMVTVIGLSMIQTSDSDESVTIEKTPTLKTDKKLVNDYNVYSFNLPENLNFAGETVPLNMPDIRERADREFLVNTYWQSNGILLIKRAQKYFPIIEPILREYNIPDDFKYLAVIESGLQPVTSPAGASGFWQIMKATGKEYGLEVNSNVDERFHIEKATRVACEYLKNSKERFGSWTLAAAAYNAGNAGINRELEKQQVDNYYDLALNPETGRYMFRIMAIKEILQAPEKFGFNVEPDHAYQLVPTKDVTVDYEIEDLSAFAKAQNINYKILKIHNPWLREGKLNNQSRKVYQIKIPEAGYYN
ncbi:murein transglycosylase [Nonlabens sp. MIC269]|uniref:lytic transglycosylase domain-containing protein n=1 Tax=Nonlabens sp. MIC269 TaxID=1476901 RepID=UPI00071F8D9D|nr:lytic transglycosylase domain-containing protein [Nonlabens sp. MIC269]ALM22030.1 murein transglycosylase [Nonlabens sp. MIC269]